MALNWKPTTGFTQEGGGSVNSDGTLIQNERLFASRARYDTASDYNGGDRGSRAYIKLMTNDKSKTKARGHAEDGYAQATSLASGPNVIGQAIDGGKYGGYANFLISSVRGSLDEKVQIAETFGDGEVTYYFGRQPIAFQISGTLIDSPDNNWFLQWIEMYGHVLRGTQLARNMELVKLVLPNMELIGTISHTSWEQRSDNDVTIPFEFQFLAKQIIPKPVLNIGSALSDEFALINFSAMSGFASQSAINSIKKFTAILADPASPKSAVAAALANIGKGVGGIGAAVGSTISGAGSAVSGVANSIGGTVSGISKAVGGAFSSVTSGISSVISPITDGLGSIFKSVNTNLVGIRASLFSPIYGVLSSLTRLVSNVLGDAGSIFNAVISPVRDILRDITNISTQAAGLVNMVNNAINGATGQIRGLDNSLSQTLATVKNSAGIIASAPVTLANSLRNLVNAGRFPITASFLQNKPRAFLGGGNRPATKIALLNSGNRNAITQGATI